MGAGTRHPTPKNGPCNSMPGCAPNMEAMEEQGQGAWTMYSAESCTFQPPMQGREVGRQPWGCPRGGSKPTSRLATGPGRRALPGVGSQKHALGSRPAA